jgi:hypothetical protein
VGERLQVFGGSVVRSQDTIEDNGYGPCQNNDARVIQDSKGFRRVAGKRSQEIMGTKQVKGKYLLHLIWLMS